MSIINTFKTVSAVIKAFIALNSDFLGVLARASRDPGLPASAPTSSYWLDDPPFPDLVDVRSDKLPESADVAVIGSGITAVAVARAYLLEAQRKNKPSGNVVVLEARQLASGATGRNGGHIKPASYADYGLLKKKFGADRAAAIIRFQRKHLAILPELCRAEHIDVAECRDVETVDLFLDRPSFEKYSKEVEEFSKIVPEAIHTISNSKEAQEVRGSFNRQLLACSLYHRDSTLVNMSLAQSPILRELSGRTDLCPPSGILSFHNSLPRCQSKQALRSSQSARWRPTHIPSDCTPREVPSKLGMSSTPPTPSPAILFPASETR